MAQVKVFTPEKCKQANAFGAQRSAYKYVYASTQMPPITIQIMHSHAFELLMVLFSLEAAFIQIKS